MSLAGCQNSIFTSKNVWRFLIKIQLTKSNPKFLRGVNPPCLMPIRVNLRRLIGAKIQKIFYSILLPLGGMAVAVGTENSTVVAHGENRISHTVISISSVTNKQTNIGYLLPAYWIEILMRLQKIFYSILLPRSR